MPSMPLIPGSPTSTSATSGGSAPIRSSAVSIVRKLPVQRKPSEPSIIMARHSRILRSSSITATLTGPEAGEDDDVALIWSDISASRNRGPTQVCPYVVALFIQIQLHGNGDLATR